MVVAIAAVALVAGWAGLEAWSSVRAERLAGEHDELVAWVRAMPRARPVLEGAPRECDSYAEQLRAVADVPDAALFRDDAAIDAIVAGRPTTEVLALAMQHEAALQAWNAVATCDHSELPLDLSRGVEGMDAPLAPLFHATTLALASACARSDDECVGTAVRAMRLGQDLAPGGAMLGVMAASARLELAMRALSRAANGASNDALARAARALRALDLAWPSLVDALATESVAAAATTRSDLDRQGTLARLAALEAWAFFLGEARAWERARHAHDAAQRSQLRALAARRASSTSPRVLEGAGRLELYVDHDAATRARVRALVVALERRVGVAGELPVDPFDGRPLRIDVSRVWSVGPNGTDDHGAEDDIVVELARSLRTP
ncbi:Hypothetical protein I5071_37090 [Sandaracinus amylolyticus]|nr:Hypothetical protein I5071_37090 [Sandaracinus amylolyticus]